MWFEVERLEAFYRGLKVLHGVNLGLREGEVLAVLGPNGAGKTTLLHALMGLVRAEGKVLLEGVPLVGPPEVRARRVGYAMEGRRLFPGLTVRENLLVGLERPGKVDLAPLLALFPRLEVLLFRLASTLSGGEAQMVAIGRALLRRPRLLLLDEPSLGLAPILVKELAEKLSGVFAWGVRGVIVVEQNLGMALRLAHRVVVLQGGRIVLEAKREELDTRVLQRVYLGEL
jgi:branched-chain amino acid transport system ATP-binding protein